MEVKGEFHIQKPLYGIEALVNTIEDEAELKVALDREVERTSKLLEYFDN